MRRKLLVVTLLLALLLSASSIYSYAMGPALSATLMFEDATDDTELDFDSIAGGTFYRMPVEGGDAILIVGVYAEHPNAVIDRVRIRIHDRLDPSNVGYSFDGTWDELADEPGAEVQFASETGVVVRIPLQVPAGLTWWMCKIEAWTPEGQRAHGDRQLIVGGLHAWLAAFGTATPTTPVVTPATPTATETTPPTATPTTTQTATPTATATVTTTPAVPSIVVEDQAIANGTVVVPQAVIQQRGWMVIHNSTATGGVGPDIGHAPLLPGVNTNVVVSIDLAQVTPQLWAMLHVDEGLIGVYEFPGADVPVVFNGQVVQEPFMVTVPATPTATMTPPITVTPSISVTDQMVMNDMVVVAQAVIEQQGWMVIHNSTATGGVGPDIGHAPLMAGVNTNVMVPIDVSQVTPQLWTMLHVDAGQLGVYEFPGADVPVVFDGQVVQEPFMVTLPTTPTVTPVPAGPLIALEEVASGLVSPVGVIPPGDGSGRLFIVDQAGQIRVLDPSGQLLPTPFLDISSKMVTLNPNYDERGLLGLAFHPNYASNGRFFVYYSAPLRAGAPAGWNHTSTISEFQVSSDPNVADPNSERIVLQIDKPQGNHNAGDIEFGPDGYLYIPIGDGGGANDAGLGHPPMGNGQDTTTLLGNILRIDVDGDMPYSIPADNPFVNDPSGRPEIFAYGFRNPYGISFDSEGDREFFVANAGQNRWEEVNMVELGGNYGWNIKEGTHCFDPQNPDMPLDTCPDVGARGEPLLPPIIEYANAGQPGGLGIVVVGGHVYRGSALPQFQGMFVFGDYSTDFGTPDGTLLIATRAASGLWPFAELRVQGQPNERIGHFVLAFGEDENRELYVCGKTEGGPTGTTGKVWRIVPPDGTGVPTATPGTETPTATPTPAAMPEIVEVNMVNITFDPQTITVPVGTTVRWTNSDPIEHTTTSDTGLWDSGLMGTNDTFEFTFDQAGTYPYHCTPHGAAGGFGMAGTVVVQ